MDAIIVIGGDGSMTGAKIFQKEYNSSRYWNTGNH